MWSLRTKSLLFLLLISVGIYFLFDKKEGVATTLNKSIKNDSNLKKKSFLSRNHIVLTKQASLKPQERKNNIIVSKQEIIKKETLQDVWDALRKDILKGELSPHYLEDEFISKLKNESNEEVYNDLYLLLSNNLLSNPKKQLVISLLAAIATKESTQLLYQLISDGLIDTDRELKYSMLRAIKKLPDEQLQDEERYKIASIMEKEWHNINDKSILNATTIAMAKIGTKNTLSMFTKELETKGSYDQDIRNNIEESMTYIRNPSLIADLSTSLKTSQSNLVTSSSAIALANIGRTESVEALLDWAVNMPYDKLDQVTEVFTIAVNRSPSAISVLEKHLPSQKFDTYEIMLAVKGVLNSKNKQVKQ